MGMRSYPSRSIARCPCLPAIAGLALAGAAGCSGPHLQQDEPWRPPPAVREGSRAGWAWTGRELLHVNGKGGLALDPATGRWRPVPAVPGGGAPDLLPLADGKVLAAVLGDDGTAAFHAYDPASDGWQDYGSFAIDPRPVAEQGEGGFFFGVALEHGAVFFLLLPGEPRREIVGVRVDGPDQFRSIRPLSWARTLGDPVQVVASFRDEVLIWGDGGPSAENFGWIYDARADRWSDAPETDLSHRRRYGFGSCAAGREVFIFGGAAGSMSFWFIENGLAFSFEDHRWRTLPAEEAPLPRWHPSVASAGNRIFAWGGTGALDRDEGDRNGAILDLATGRWSAVPIDGAPPALSSYCSFLCYRTGREILLIDWAKGLFDRILTEKPSLDGPPAPLPVWGFDPARGTWRKISD